MYLRARTHATRFCYFSFFSGTISIIMNVAYVRSHISDVGMSYVIAFQICWLRDKFPVRFLEFGRQEAKNISNNCSMNRVPTQDLMDTGTTTTQ